MAKKLSTYRKAATMGTGFVLTQSDANKFEKSAKNYAAAATTSKAKAQKTLVSLGIYTSTGKLTKRYG